MNVHESFAERYASLPEADLYRLSHSVESLVPEAREALRLEMGRRSLAMEAVDRTAQPVSKMDSVEDASVGDIVSVFVGVIFLAGIVLTALVVVGLIFSVGPAYKPLDKTGWISHDHDTPVWIQGNWMIGEYRVCELAESSASAEKTPAKVPSLFCGKTDHGYVDWMVEGYIHHSAGPGVFHVLPVTYWGRIDRQDVATSWRCQRNERSLTCKALN
jgi:hypothetical protein